VPPSSTSSSRADNGCSAGRKNKNHPEGGVGRRSSREQSEVAIKLKPQILGAADGQPHASEVLRRMQSCYTTLAGVVPEASCDPSEASFDTRLHLFCGTYTRVGRGHFLGLQHEHMSDSKLIGAAAQRQEYAMVMCGAGKQYQGKFAFQQSN
jgi:hypothetical protein